MKTLSLKLDEKILDEVDAIVKRTRMSRNAYINQALNFYNKLNRRRLLKVKFKSESKAVRVRTLKVLEEMEALDDGRF